VPHFVLQELQQVADKDQKRGGGETGDSQSDQGSLPDRILINPTDYEDIPGRCQVSAVCPKIDGTLLTNDYNLSKVASVQKVPVLNINDLVHAVQLL